MSLHFPDDKDFEEPGEPSAEEIARWEEIQLKKRKMLQSIPELQEAPLLEEGGL